MQFSIIFRHTEIVNENITFKENMYVFAENPEKVLILS